jgi:hypothetical protein
MTSEATASVQPRERWYAALVSRLRGARGSRFWGGVGSLAVAAFLFSRVGIDGFLYRDEAIYAYGGQQMTHGVPPYVSIFDPKGPLSTFICGIAAAVAQPLGVADLTMMRLAFFAMCVLTALFVYLLVLQLWGSVLGALTAAVVFASFKGFAQDALRGPDAHSAGPLFAVLSMWLALRRQWFWAAFAGSLATLVKQTYGFYTIVVVIAAVLYSPQRRGRALAQSLGGALAPLVGTWLYFLAEGAVGRFWESAGVFPVRGLHRAKSQTVPGNLRHVAGVLWRQYNFSGILFEIGTALLVLIAVVAIARVWPNWRAAVLDPRMFIVGLTMVSQWAYISTDFLSYDDLYQLLPYAAAGFGAAVALGTRRYRTAPTMRVLTASTATGLAALVALSCIWFVEAPDNNHGLPAQRAMACAVNRILPAGTRLYAVGDPVPLVLTHRRNPDRYIYLDSGIAQWKIKHTAGGFAGWVREVTQPQNSIVILQHWQGSRVAEMIYGIRRAGYRRAFVGGWRAFVTPAAAQQARRVGIRLTARPTPWPLETSGAQFRVTSCGGG